MENKDKNEPIGMLFDHLRNFTLDTMHINNNMLQTISDLEKENKMLLDRLKVKDELIEMLMGSIKKIYE